MKDRVTPALREQVFERDLEAILRIHLVGAADPWPLIVVWMGDRLVTAGRATICPAILIDPAQLGKCWGRWTIEHVKDESRLGKRAPSDLAHCVSLCEGHTENGMKAGYQWNTAHRPELRAYLRGEGA